MKSDLHDIIDFDFGKSHNFVSEQCIFKSAGILALSYHNPHKLTEASNKHMLVSTCHILLL